MVTLVANLGQVIEIGERLKCKEGRWHLLSQDSTSVNLPH